MAGRRLALLVEHGLVCIKDEIRFDFKHNTFSAVVAEGGILHKCKWKNSRGLLLTVLPGRTFLTLSEWTESCIQGILKEFSTRYSSWKRVFHSTSGKDLDSLWKVCNEKRLSKIKRPTMSQLRQINQRLLEKLAQANEEIDKLKAAEKKEAEVEKEKAEQPPPPQTVLDSPYGTYMIIQRMMETKSPILESVQAQGLDKFRKHLKKFATSRTIHDGGAAEWFEKTRGDAPQMNRDIAKFVYDFFVNGKKRKHEHESVRKRKRY